MSVPLDARSRMCMRINVVLWHLLLQLIYL